MKLSDASLNNTISYTLSVLQCMDTVSVKKTSNKHVQVIEIQIALQDGHHLVNCNEIHEKLRGFVSSDKQGFRKSRVIT